MKAVLQFVRLDRRARRLLLRAGVLLVSVRLGLWLLPFPFVRWALDATSSRRAEDGRVDPQSIRRVGWAIDRAARCVPDATCLVRALAAEWLLKRLGQPGEVRIGVSRSTEGDLRAHAWLVSDGRIVLGKVPNLRAYSVLSAPNRDPR
jgi:hypothetical protein